MVKRSSESPALPEVFKEEASIPKTNSKSSRRRFLNRDRLKELGWVAIVLALAAWAAIEQRENTRLRRELYPWEFADRTPQAAQSPASFTPEETLDPPAAPQAATAYASSPYGSYSPPPGEGQNASGVRPATFP
jgi:hypothetical protein